MPYRWRLRRGPLFQLSLASRGRYIPEYHLRQAAPPFSRISLLMHSPSPAFPFIDFSSRQPPCCRAHHPRALCRRLFCWGHGEDTLAAKVSAGAKRQSLVEIARQQPPCAHYLSPCGSFLPLLIVGTSIGFRLRQHSIESLMFVRTYLAAR